MVVQCIVFPSIGCSRVELLVPCFGKASYAARCPVHEIECQPDGYSNDSIHEIDLQRAFLFQLLTKVRLANLV